MKLQNVYWTFEHWSDIMIMFFCLIHYTNSSIILHAWFMKYVVNDHHTPYKLYDLPLVWWGWIYMNKIIMKLQNVYWTFQHWSDIIIMFFCVDTLSSIIHGPHHNIPLSFRLSMNVAHYVRITHYAIVIIFWIWGD